MSRNFKAVGISYKTAPLEIREVVAFDEVSTKKFSVKLKEVLGLDEVLILSTCNRTEIYYFSEEDLKDQISSMVDVFHNTGNLSSAEYFVSYGHEEAINHLFEVSLGLDSLVLGDIQITNQVKKAYQWSADESMAGPFLHRLLHTIFYTNKRVVQETPFRDGTASLASAAIEIAAQFNLNYNHPKITIIGLGNIGANVAENLKDTDADICLINRTKAKAEQLAAQFGFRSSAIEDIKDAVRESHVVISAVQVHEPIITAEMFKKDEAHPKLLIDLSVPRSIEDEAGEVPGILLYNVDQLQEKTSQALERRRAAIPKVKAIISESISEFSDWSQEMEVSPAIKRFKEALEEIRKQEIARYLDKLDPKEAKILDKATKNMIQKVIKLPVLQLKAACRRGEADSLIGGLNDLFNLEKEETKSPR